MADKRLLRLIRGFLTAGVLEGGLVGPVTEGTPQGGPLSPLLSNLMLDVLDKELEKRGHRFVRYADDCNIYVRSRRAGERVTASVTLFLARRLKLMVNADESAADRPSARAFLGFSFKAGRTPRRRIAPQALARFKTRTREMTRRTESVSLAHLVTALSRYLLGCVDQHEGDTDVQHFHLPDRAAALPVGSDPPNGRPVGQAREPGPKTGPRAYAVSVTASPPPRPPGPVRA